MFEGQPVITTEQQEGPHGLRAALHTAGEVYVSGLFAFVGPHRPDHWELVVQEYEREHPRSTDAT